MKKMGLIAGGAVLLVVAAVVIYKMTRPAPPPPPVVVEAPKGPDPAHLAKIADLVRRIEDYEAKGQFKDALTLVKELAALEPADPRPAQFKPRLEEKQRKLEVWLGALKKAEGEKADALRRDTAPDWVKVIAVAEEAEKVATTDADRAQARALIASATQYRDWALAREEEKKGKLDAAIELAAKAVAAAEPPAALTAYKASLDRKKRKTQYDAAAYVARAEGVPAKAYELWQKARPLAEDAKDVAEADGRLHELKPFVDPAERERRYEEAMKAGDAALAEGKLEAAETAYKDAQRLKGTDAKPAQGLAKISAARSAKAVDVLVAEAKAAEGKREWADAIDAYDKAIRLKPGDAALVARRKELVDTHRPPTISLKLSEATGIKMDLVLIKRGVFGLGDDAKETPIPKDFWMQTLETTQAQWELVMNTKPWLSASVQVLPVEGVSWEDVQKYLEKLNALVKDQLKGRRFALPTDAEWEYACRAGSKGKWTFGDNESAFDLHGWQAAVTVKSPQPVGKRQPNAWGLFDMHGNVAEWCADEAGRTSDDAPALRWVRGGSWNDRASKCRSSAREKLPPSTSNAFVGFRVILRPAP